MKQILAGLVLAAIALPTAAEARDVGVATATTGASVQMDTVDQCMWVAAVQVSYTAARNEDVYSLARKQCGHRRAPRTAAEIETAQSFPALIAGLRERRRTHDALYGIVEVAYAR